MGESEAESVLVDAGVGKAVERLQADNSISSTMTTMEWDKVASDKAYSRFIKNVS